MNERLREKLKKVSGIMRRIEAEDWIKAVRESEMKGKALRSLRHNNICRENRADEFTNGCTLD